VRILLLGLGEHPDASRRFRFHRPYDDESMFQSGFLGGEEFVDARLGLCGPPRWEKTGAER
jgi:hypothetical protein